MHSYIFLFIFLLAIACTTEIIVVIEPTIEPTIEFMPTIELTTVVEQLDNFVPLTEAEAILRLKEVREKIEDLTSLDLVCNHKMPKPGQDAILFVYCGSTGNDIIMVATNIVFLSRGTSLQRILIMQVGPNDAHITECIHTNLPGVEDDDTNCNQYKIGIQEGMDLMLEPYIAFTEN